jgi:hypothetical protein
VRFLLGVGRLAKRSSVAGIESPCTLAPKWLGAAVRLGGAVNDVVPRHFCDPSPAVDQIHFEQLLEQLGLPDAGQLARLIEQPPHLGGHPNGDETFLGLIALLPLSAVSASGFRGRPTRLI